jgi:hypothetical protein
LEKHPNDIPLFNKDGLIIKFAQVSPEDYKEVMKYRWHKGAHYMQKELLKEKIYKCINFY